MAPILPHQQQLIRAIEPLTSCVVAFSGGVDSAVVAKAAHLALGKRALAVTGVSPSLASGELETACQVARSIGISHQTIETGELADAGYLANQPNRCWHCKTELYGTLRQMADRLGFQAIVNGANADDQNDFRPGLQAASEQQVVSPLADCGMTKAEVRQLAQAWNLEVWNKPATPCLSSRVVYGLEITPERLSRIDAAEAWLRDLGFSSVRVRCHHDEMARIEISPDQLSRLGEPNLRRSIIERLRELGFRYVTVDLEGFRSGSFQQLIGADELVRYGSSTTG